VYFPNPGLTANRRGDPATTQGSAIAFLAARSYQDRAKRNPQSNEQIKFFHALILMACVFQL
jgi:hypothetical protein